MTPADERPVLKADGGRMARAHGEREQNKSKKAKKKREEHRAHLNHWVVQGWDVLSWKVINHFTNEIQIPKKIWSRITEQIKTNHFLLSRNFPPNKHILRNSSMLGYRLRYFRAQAESMNTVRWIDNNGSRSSIEVFVWHDNLCRKHDRMHYDTPVLLGRDRRNPMPIRRMEEFTLICEPN